LYVVADPARLVQCVGNLLTNAAKYTDPGGQIRVELRRDAEQAVISISDNGIGIPEELRPHLFDLFVQGTRTLDRAQGGLGIGLAVVKRLVEMHGGQVVVVNHGGGQPGTTFEIRLPRIEHIEETAAASVPLKVPTRRVLVVDDNTDAADSSMLLRVAGHQTETVHSATQAIARVESFRPDVILLDIGLPEIDGYEVARRIRARPNGHAVMLVAVTGYGQSEDRMRAQAAGFDAHLVKPLEFAMLERILAQMDSKRSFGHGGSHAFDSATE
jgi:CheY-like chemotaxis protein